MKAFHQLLRAFIIFESFSLVFKSFSFIFEKKFYILSESFFLIFRKLSIRFFKSFWYITKTSLCCHCNQKPISSNLKKFQCNFPIQIHLKIQIIQQLIQTTIPYLSHNTTSSFQIQFLLIKIQFRFISFSIALEHLLNICRNSHKNFKSCCWKKFRVILSIIRFWNFNWELFLLFSSFVRLNVRKASFTKTHSRIFTQSSFHTAVSIFPPFTMLRE